MVAIPFALVTFAGLAIGIVLRLRLRRIRSASYPLRVRHRRTIGVPLAASAAIAAVGAAILLSPSDMISAWRGAAVLLTAAAAWMWLVLALPRWWQLPALVLLALPALAAADVWTSTAESGYGHACNGDLVLRVAGADEAGADAAGGDGVEIALLRVDLNPGPPQLAVRVLPVVALAAGATTAGEATSGEATSGEATVPTTPAGVTTPAAPGAWSPPLLIGEGDAVVLEVATERYAPLLWWYPQGQRVRSLALSAPGETVTVTAAAARTGIRSLLSAWGLRQESSQRLLWPAGTGEFLQPGVSVLQSVCR